MPYKQKNYLLSENFQWPYHPNIYPPNSLDCNPIDYYVSGVVEQETDKTQCNTKHDLNARIIAEFTNLNEIIGKACGRFQSHMEVMVEVGDFFK